MALHPEGKRLDALQEDPGIVRAYATAEVAKWNEAHSQYKGQMLKISQIMAETQPAVRWLRLTEQLEFGVFPIKSSCIDDYPSDSGPMAADPLCQRMYDHVSAVLDRAE